MHTPPSSANGMNHTFLCSDVWCEKYIDILNHLGVAYECDGRTDGQTEPSLAIARSNDPRLMTMIMCKIFDTTVEQS